ncbi:glyoxylate/hydroxypyruvate reductase A [Undibacterium sp. RTI2.1]|uniref:2-hydroxyacid dehydrogenase n=1 Tax=unclassified Undibacterium TaxID=2630295 RepID=UPI002AB5647F|nr:MULTISPECIES: glyoxylate/hydroxypyruvate reductase A [unclassified Undibacterium]MDY7539475.1 glyoxylate/hydroxypyruvate reductase A [Undibacterium sp. 5I1]MEB0029609.1 glyoxylate/hydroxypyruvate reductase A [Undibacterium sp. RTI2.1]MEB0116080.1 glyoxylate/hydroxypyruvate reductase A [Undibacterium sp. RTI2.2]MEB0230733.1 glyoxylate/hydroxypyruvate reductase A [Undibacterium sp. 10I3]MEB0258788.1 glyoxylate/hydroxypyruvate reductase A [Undibacterium sp. 5I1]
MRIIFYSSGINPEQWLNSLNRALPNSDIRVWQDGDVAAADYAIVWKPPVAMLAGRSDLKAIFNLGAGVDAILQLGDALPRGVPVIRLDDAGMGTQMAEYVSHALLRYYRRFDHYDQQRQAQHWQLLTPFEKQDFSVGVMGLGVLGERIVEAISGFGFPINGWSRTQKNIAGVTCYAGQDGLDAFLKTSKVVVCILPLTDDTRNILNRNNLQKLPKGAYIINVARGAHLVEDDLLALIREEHIAGATLDVFQTEPLPAGHAFWSESRISITPHIAAMTLRDESTKQIADKINALANGKAVTGIVDPSRGY